MHFIKPALIAFALFGSAIAQEPAPAAPADTAAPAPAAGGPLTVTNTIVDFPLDTATVPVVVVTEVVTSTLSANQSETITQTIASTVTESLSISQLTETISATNTAVSEGESSTISVTATITEFAPAPVETEVLSVTDTVLVSGDFSSTLFGAGRPGAQTATVTQTAAPENTLIPDNESGASGLRPLSPFLLMAGYLVMA